MKSTISILGCGWLGKALAQDLIHKNYKVKGSTTTPSKKSDLEEIGIETYVFNLKEELPHHFFKTEYLIIAIPPQEINDFKNLISKLNQSELKGIVIISSTSVYNTNNQTKTEQSPINQSLPAQIEKLFTKELKKPFTIVRFGGLFGPERNPIRFLNYFNAIKNPKGYINFIHLEDCIAIISAILQQNKFNEIYNAVMPHHPTREDFYNFLAEISNQPKKETDTRAKHWKIISSQKIKKDLNYHFKHQNIFKAIKNIKA